MRSLFVKIFLSYWMAQALFIVLAILVTMALASRAPDSPPGSPSSQNLAEAVEAYKEGGTAGVHAYLGHVHDTQHVRAYVFDEQGQRDLRAQRPPEWVRAGRGETPHSSIGMVAPADDARPPASATH